MLRDAEFFLGDVGFFAVADGDGAERADDDLRRDTRRELLLAAAGVGAALVDRGLAVIVTQVATGLGSV